MEKYTIETINGREFKVFPNGGKLLHRENKFPHLPKHAGVYVLTDNLTGLKYVGSSQNVNQRAGNYFSLTKSEVFKKGLFKQNKLSVENLTFELLEDCKYLSWEQRIELEAEYVVKLNTLHPNGLNALMPSIKRHPKKVKRVFNFVYDEPIEHISVVKEKLKNKPKYTYPKKSKVKQQPFKIKPFVNILTRHAD